MYYIKNPNVITPVEQHNGIYFKRDDYFYHCEVRGGKVRACLALSKNAKGLVTAGSRYSPQVNIVAAIGQSMNIPVRIHTPIGELTQETKIAIDKGAIHIPHRIGYNSVIKARAKEDAEKHGYTLIPFGMECKEAIELTSIQTSNIPAEIERIVVPVGSAMSLIGILWGLLEQERISAFDISNKISILGVQVGANPIKTLDKYAPRNWRDIVTLVKSNIDYSKRPEKTKINGIELDYGYEAKCIPYLKKGDCMWIVGIRENQGTL